ncbi:MAG TPA: hypothetical protein VGC37_20210 [Friedmanniella sp.]
MTVVPGTHDQERVTCHLARLPVPGHDAAEPFPAEVAGALGVAQPVEVEDLVLEDQVTHRRVVHGRRHGDEVGEQGVVVRRVETFEHVVA